MSSPIPRCLLTLLTLLAIVSPAPAEKNDWLIRGRLLDVDPKGRGGPVTGIAGSGLQVGEDWTPEVDFTYFVKDRLSLDLVLAWTSHDASGTGSLAPLGQIVDAKVLPPTLTLLYHLDPRAKVRPYLGGGLTYANFFGEKATASLETALAGPTTVSLDDKIVPAFQVGTDIGLSDDWFLNLDAKYVPLDTRATLVTGGVARTSDIEMDPWIFGVGVGTRLK